MTEILSLPDLAAQINAAHAAATTAANAAVQHALNAGQLLIEAKNQTPHGQWLPWLAANCSFSVRTSQAYVRLARELPKLDEPNTQRVAHLPLREVLELLADDSKPTSKQSLTERLKRAETDLENAESLSDLELVIADADSILSDAIRFKFSAEKQAGECFASLKKSLPAFGENELLSRVNDGSLVKACDDRMHSINLTNH